MRSLIDVMSSDPFWIPSNSASGLPIDTVRWDLCNLPIRTSSVDIIITDMPFGKRYPQNNPVQYKTWLPRQLVDVLLTKVDVLKDGGCICRMTICPAVFQNGLEEEELGPVPLLSERNGPCEQTWDGKGGLIDPG